MNQQNKIQQIEPWDMNGYELHAFEFLAALDNRVSSDQKHLEARLKALGRWRDFRIAVTAIERVIDALYKSVPAETVKHMVHMQNFGECMLRAKPAIKIPNAIPYVQEEVYTIVNEVLTNVCAICVCDEGHQRSCKLRKALKHVAPSTNAGDKYHCQYRDVVQDNELGRYC